MDFARESTKPTAILLDHVAMPDGAQDYFERQRRCVDAGLATFPSAQRAAVAMSRYIEYHQRQGLSS